MSKGQRTGLEAKAEVTSGFVSTGSTNLRGEAGKVLEPVERPGAGCTCERGSPFGVRSVLRRAQEIAGSGTTGACP